MNLQYLINNIYDCFVEFQLKTGRINYEYISSACIINHKYKVNESFTFIDNIYLKRIIKTK